MIFGGSIEVGAHTRRNFKRLRLDAKGAPNGATKVSMRSHALAMVIGRLASAPVSPLPVPPPPSPPNGMVRECARCLAVSCTTLAALLASISCSCQQLQVKKAKEKPLKLPERTSATTTTTARTRHLH